jgi:hypothetical protein
MAPNEWRGRKNLKRQKKTKKRSEESSRFYTPIKAKAVLTI